MNEFSWKTISIVVVALFVTMILFLSIVIWSIRRHRDPKLHIECEQPIDQLIPSLSGLTLTTAITGNSVEIFENGAFFDVLCERIQAAQNSVHFETFLWREGTLGARMSDVLAAQPLQEFGFACY